MHTTNYTNTFIEVADDCPATAAVVPPLKGGEPTIAGLQLSMMQKAPYQYTSDDIIFGIYALRSGIAAGETERARFFSRGQACLRSSPLTRRYGWGIHSNAEGKVAAFGIESEEYKALSADGDLKHLKGMRSKRA